MKTNIKIFIADYVPLKNKGEEAIIRGIEDLYKELYDEVIIGVFDKVDTPIIKGNLHIFPVDIVYPHYNYFLYKKHKVWQIISVLLSYAFLLGYRWHVKSIKKNVELNKFFFDSDLILVGHDGSFSIPTCNMILWAKKYNKKVAMFGSGFFISPKIRKLVNPLYKKAFNACDFIVVRENGAYEQTKKMLKGNDLNKLKITSDPAFYVKIDNNRSNNIKKILSNSKLSDKQIVGVTVCENSTVFLGAFNNISSLNKKREIHVSFICNLINKLNENYSNLTFLFIPHNTDSSFKMNNELLNDLELANLICSGLDTDNCMVLDDELTVREIKHLIASCSFLIGERTHSIINAISVKTPFLAITNNKDKRTTDIIGKMSGLDELICKIDNPDFEICSKKLVEIFSKKEFIKNQILQTISIKLKDDLLNVFLSVNHE